MTSPSVSFRITRHTEDLAQTIHVLSQRVVQLEQRFSALEAHLSQPKEQPPSSEHLTSLANVDQLLSDCRELLAETSLPTAPSLDRVASVQLLTTPLAADPFAEAEADEAIEDVA